MNSKIRKNLIGQNGNYIFPFFWQHGEPEEVLRRYMKAIYDSHIRAVCVESRPHPDFAGPGWWKDMDVILDEARKRDMQVWILDDSHFPTGFCNGILNNEPAELLRQSITCEKIAEVFEGDLLCVETEKYRKAADFKPSRIELMKQIGPLAKFDDDQLLGFFAVPKDGTNRKDIISLEPEENQLCWLVPKGSWKVCVCHKTRNRGPHRNYMNMMDYESCHKLIEAVYEPHFLHYKEDFGKTIAGFFSDEPELGNSHLYEMGKTIEEMDDLPWSRELESWLQKVWGDDFARYLPLLWEKEFSDIEKARVRYDYMNAVTELVKKDFSWQIGEWCRNHGVAYIGHLIEDNNQHSRTGNSLGHYFRGLAGQDMAGIDDIGGQVYPYMEDVYIHNPEGTDRDGEFYHYVLGKLASSAAAIEPVKKGRAMCEIFGAYGWEEGVRLEKYLADHFMVRGINRFVPHAFSPKKFPDPDCPPHFYAHGNNPQYRHFGYLMQYMNRICELISGGYHVSQVALLYHGEAEWCGQCMFVQKPAHILADRQIEYDIIPSDVFADRVLYRTKTGAELIIGTQKYRTLIIPEMQFITAEVADAVVELERNHFPVFFINRLPEGICNQRRDIPGEMKQCKIIRLPDLIEKLDELGIGEIHITPENNRIRYMHYVNENHVFYLVNEGSVRYEGEVTVPVRGNIYRYDAWRNKLCAVEYSTENEETVIKTAMDPSESFIIVFDSSEPEFEPQRKSYTELKSEKISGGWKRSLCRAIDYPYFRDPKEVLLPDSLETEMPTFSGFVRYEKEIYIPQSGYVYMEITDAAEGVELFVNDISAGIQIVPVYRYDITDLVKEGKNYIKIEVATTLAREVKTPKGHSSRPKIPMVTKSGICGDVVLRYQQTGQDCLNAGMKQVLKEYDDV